jgi:23S rRNA pseudouridine955/2504/2580 synthase/23S rRNA pseudouridine1911/1915/1917 synthase
VPRAGIIHRLDKDTTGVLAIAKTPKVRDSLMEQFYERNVKKKYLALVDGIFLNKQGTRDTFLAKKKSYEGQTIWGSAPSGQQAVTQWKVIAEGNLASLVICQPFTGRTHQIRIHLSELGHPILIDRQYAANYRSPLFTKRVLLHALSLEFDLDGKTIKAQADLPQDFQQALVSVGIEKRALSYDFS